MPATLDGLQALHEERWEQLVSVLKFYGSALIALPSTIDEAVGALKDKCETQASLDDDLQEFVDALKAADAAGGEFKALSVEVHDFFVAEAQADDAKVRPREREKSSGRRVAGEELWEKSSGRKSSGRRKERRKEK